MTRRFSLVSFLLAVSTAAAVAERTPTERLDDGDHIAVHMPDPVKDPRKLVYICAVAETFAGVKADMNHAVRGLRPDQAFNLIVVRKNGESAFAKHLVNATPSAKRDAEAFLKNVAPSDDSDPLPALEFGFSQNPQLVYFVADHEFADGEGLLKKLSELNRDHSVQINPIAVVDEDGSPESLVTLFKDIARRSGGVLKIFSRGLFNQPASQPTTRP